MLDYVIQNERNNLILFIHGFNGSKETWKNSASAKSFPELLAEEELINEHFDIAHFEYFTTLIGIYASIKSKIAQLKTLFKITAKSQKNISVDEIANTLRTTIRYSLKSYDSIVVVAHSMGGLVAKACILKDIDEFKPSKIKLFISLAVPHSGSETATLGKLISKHVQINDLSPLSELSISLNKKWVKADNGRPITKYFYGTHDEIVDKKSAVAIDQLEQDEIACDEDHLSISKPAGNTNLVYKATLEIIKEFLTGETGELDLSIKPLESETQYDDEYFVLKLILADIHKSTITNAKEHFLNAEYARKLFCSQSDQKKLKKLYSNIKSLYQDSYSKYLSGKIQNPEGLVADVHEKIIEQDSKYLQTMLLLIDGYHKKGMLHQLANDLDESIWWSEDQAEDKLKKLKEDK